MAHIEFNDKNYDIPAGSTAKETFESLQQVIPEMSNAKLEKKGENWVAKLKLAKLG